MADFVATAETEINASPVEVWLALLFPQLIQGDVLGSQVVSDWQPGSPIVWKDEYEASAYQDKGEVVEIETGRRLKVTHFSPLSGQEDVPENYHTLLYELTANGGTTHVSLSQDKNASADEAERAKSIWEMSLRDLKEVVEGG